MKRLCVTCYTIIHLSVFFISCERKPLFNFVGDEARSSESFVINPCMNLDAIKRVGSVYGSPFATADSSTHLGIDIGGDVMVAFISSTDGIVLMTGESHDNYTINTDVIIMYNSEFSLLYTFEPANKITVEEYQHVKTGDIIGYLGAREIGYIDQCVHYGLYKDGEFVCPIPYLREDFRNRLNEVYKTLEGRYPENICNCPEHQHYFE